MGYERDMAHLFTEDEVRKLIIAAVAEAVAPLHARIAQLEAEVARLKKNSGNSSKPPSNDIVKPPKHDSSPKRRKKRSIGGQPGHAKHERKPFAPEDVDRIVECELPSEEARGLRPLSRWHVVQQVELAQKPFVVTEYRARRYRDPRTGQIIIASLPPEIAAAGLVGPRLSAAIAFQKAACHSPTRRSKRSDRTRQGSNSVADNWRRSCKSEQANKSVARWAEKLFDRLRKLFHTLHRRDQWTPATFVLRMDAVRRGFLQQVRHPPAWSEARTLAVRFRAPRRNVTSPSSRNPEWNRQTT